MACRGGVDLLIYLLPEASPPQARLVHPGQTAPPRVFYCAFTSVSNIFGSSRVDEAGVLRIEVTGDHLRTFVGDDQPFRRRGGMVWSRNLSLLSRLAFYVRLRTRRQGSGRYNARSEFLGGLRMKFMLAIRRGHSQKLIPLLLLLAGLWCGGCAEQAIPPKMALLADARPYLYSDRDWAVVLRDDVRYGLVDYEALSRNREPLDRYYALLSVTGPTRTPEQFPSRAHVVAYYLNAYNALVLCAVMQRYPVATMYDLSLPHIEYGYVFTVDGRQLTLGKIEAALLKESQDDVRTLLATSRGALGAPRLFNEPISPQMLEAQLTRAAAEALDNPDLLRIDHVNKSIFVWQLILRREEEFISYWKTRRRVRAAYLFNVLLDLASPQRRRLLQTAVGYSFGPISFDRTLNRWSPQDGETVAGGELVGS